MEVVVWNPSTRFFTNANQKMILSAFGMNSGTVKREAEKLADQFEKYDQTAAESSEE
ncbi:MAG: hypothetical protein LKE85_05455 [Lachnospiraceae bacterium]|jgi:phage-related minor tail protein|nr:hypothetical protein [Lachnospiraceae bacterium]